MTEPRPSADNTPPEEQENVSDSDQSGPASESGSDYSGDILPARKTGTGRHQQTALDPKSESNWPQIDGYIIEDYLGGGGFGDVAAVVRNDRSEHWVTRHRTSADQTGHRLGFSWKTKDLRQRCRLVNWRGKLSQIVQIRFGAASLLKVGISPDLGCIQYQIDDMLGNHELANFSTVFAEQ